MKRVAAILGSIIVCVVPLAVRAQVSPQRMIALVVDVSSPALITRTGAPGRDATQILHDLKSGLSGLAKVTMPYSIAVSGVMCDELRLLGTPQAKGVLTQLRAVGAAHRILSTTYSGARLTDVAQADIANEISDGRSAAVRCAGMVREPFVPSDLSLPTTEVVEAVRAAGVRSAISAFAVPPSSDRPRIVPAVRTIAGGVERGFDERPEADSHVVVVGLGSAVKVAAEILTLTSVKAVDLDALSSLDVIGGVIDPKSPASRSRLRLVERAADALQRFRSYTLPDNRLGEAFKTGVARLTRSGSKPFADALTRSITSEFAKVDVADGSITFTSRSGSVPITVSDQASYPVRIRIDVASPKLDFPSGSTRVVVVQPPGDTITFDALARSTGTFPTNVSVTSPDKTVSFGSAQLTVRSTAANIPAVVLTGGGALFLVVWFTRRVRRRKDTAVA